MSEQPIFVHSMFRAGSTYVFSVFRRAGRYTCFYEPMHELVAWAAEDADLLLLSSEDENDLAKSRALHHPDLEQPYFHEVREAWTAWHEHIKPEMVYGAYFTNSPEHSGERFYRAMSDAADRQPVFCDCRTTGRIGTLKQALGGIHIALLRNPWDQWWSYRVDEYFDIANCLVLQAAPLPGFLSGLCRERKLLKAPVDKNAEAAEFYRLHPLNAEDSYALFYALWCCAVLQADEYADCVISIDSLSQHPEYRETLLKNLSSLGVSELQFHDAHVPVAQFSSEESSWFEEQEAFVINLMRADGYGEEVIERLKAWHQELEPDRSRAESSRHLENYRRVVTQAMCRAQSLGAALEVEQEQYASSLAAAHERHKHESERRDEAHARALEIEHENHRRDIGQRDHALARAMGVIQEQESSLAQLEATAALAELRAQEIDRLSLLWSSTSARLTALESSVSWRLTGLWRHPLSVVIQLSSGKKGRAEIFRAVVQNLYSRPALVRLVRRLLGIFPPLLRWVERLLAVQAPQEFEVEMHGSERLSPRASEIHEMLLARVFSEENNVTKDQAGGP